MVDESRRRFLTKSSLAAATLAAGQVLPPAIRKALAVEPARVRGAVEDVRHVVIFMQENRSFDHYFGSLRGVRGFGDPRPLIQHNGKPIWYQPSVPGSSDYVLPFHLDSAHTSAQSMKGLNHSWKKSHEIWENHNAWVSQKTAMTMGHFQRQDLPFYYALADVFTVCDGYHASLFGPTSPNRLFLFTGTNGLSVGDDGRQAIANMRDVNGTADMARDRSRFKGHAWTTYAQRLQKAGISWQVYQEYDNYGDNTMQLFSAFRDLKRDSDLYRRCRAWAPGSTAANARASRGEHLVSAFEKDVRNGTLPQVSWIVAPYIMSEHPEAPPAYGESLTARLLTVLAENPEVWSKTVFLINYDENDGFFDHVPPALPAIDPAIGKSTVDTTGENYQGVPVGFGPRVPMLVVSPWSRGGWVNSQVFDHTSVLRFLEARFGVTEPNISPWRRAVAGDLLSAFDFAGTDPLWPELPDTAQYMVRADATGKLPAPQVPANQKMPKQEVGQRPARALPYDFDVSGRAEQGVGLRLHLTNHGRVGVALNAYDASGATAPRFYTVGTADSLEDTWSGRDDYDVSLYGPNGFLRRFAGSSPAASGPRPEVEVIYRADRNHLVLKLRNDGDKPCACRVRDAYTVGASRAYRLAPGASVESVWNIAGQDHWYDFTIVREGDRNYVRRLAGHIETGRPSFSDPAIAALGMIRDPVT